MNHPHAESLKRLYDAWKSGNFVALESECPPSTTFEIKGQGRLAGKHDREGFSRLFGQMKELSGGSLQSEVHDILASDRHGMVLSTQKLVRDGRPLEYRSVHVWRFENGKPIAGYEYLRDQVQFDQIWK